jgi:hypothetical protein
MTGALKVCMFFMKGYVYPDIQGTASDNLFELTCYFQAPHFYKHLGSPLIDPEASAECKQQAALDGARDEQLVGHGMHQALHAERDASAPFEHVVVDRCSSRCWVSIL